MSILSVGGALLEAALNNLRDHGRIAVCGMIERYNDTTPQPGPSNLFLLTSKRARMQGFIVGENWDHYLQFLDEVAPHVEHGDIDYQELLRRDSREPRMLSSSSSKGEIRARCWCACTPDPCSRVVDR